MSAVHVHVLPSVVEVVEAAVAAVVSFILHLAVCCCTSSRRFLLQAPRTNSTCDLQHTHTQVFAVPYSFGLISFVLIYWIFDFVCLLLVHLLLVKGKFGSFKNDTIATSGLSRSGSDLGKDTSRSELMIKDRFQSSLGLSLLQLGSHLLRNSGKINGFLGGNTSRLLDSNLHSIVGFVPGLEGMGINNDDGSLDQSLGTDQFIVGGIVDHIQDTDLAGADFGTPRKVSAFQTQRAEFQVASAAANGMNSLFANLGAGSGSSHEELALLAELGPTSSRLAALVASFTCNTLVYVQKRKK